MSVPFQSPSFLELDNNASGRHTVYIQEKGSVFWNESTALKSDPFQARGAKGFPGS